MDPATPLSTTSHPDPLAGLAWVGEVFFALLAVALLLVLSWRLFLRPKSTLVRVLARVPLEARRSLYLIEAAGVYLLIGAGEGGLSTLAELPAGKVREALKEASRAPNTLAARLLSLLPPRGKTAPPGEKP